jgi:Ca2+-binding RTX toxin-like protein
VATANSYSASSSHNDTVDIQGNAVNLWTIVEAGTGDTVNVGTPAHTMDGISGDLRIQAVAGQTPTVNLDDSGDTANRTIDLADEGSGYGYRVTGLLSPGNPVRGRIWLLDPAMNVSLKTGAGNDVFRVHDFNEAPALTLNAGAGSNWLDYSAYGSGVTVNLAAGTATGFAGISGIENVVGSRFNDTLTGDAANDVLIGLGGNDTLQAGSGRDILIGGDGNSALQGGNGEDILIGGWTTYDRQVDGSGTVQHAVNYDALDAIMAEWAGADSFAARQRAISGGVGSGGWALNPTTVFDDGVADSLVRNGGSDWIFAGRNDSVS